MNKVYFMGDIHGEFYPVDKFVETVSPDSTDTLVLLGDAGLNFSGSYCGGRNYKLKEKLQDTGINYFVIRGNHDDRPSKRFERNCEGWTNQASYFGKPVYMEENFPSIKYALDIPMIYEMNGKKALVMGGAYSVDKWYRLRNGMTWYDYEQMNEEEMDLVRNYIDLAEATDYKFDLVLTHTCPLKFEPIDLFIPGLNQSMVDKTMERFFDEIEEKANYSKWLFGHYHDVRIYQEINGKQQLMLTNSEVIELDSLMKDRINSLDLIQTMR